MKAYPQYCKVVLNSSDARYNNGEFQWDVTLPLIDYKEKAKWVVSVDNFNSAPIPSTGLNVGNTQTNAFANLHMREISQILSFSSKTRGMTDVILTFIGRSFYRANSTNTIAVPLAEQFWVNKQITLYFSDVSLNRLITPQDAPFQVSFLIWKAED
jgi:hypothetical protein